MIRSAFALAAGATLLAGVARAQRSAPWVRIYAGADRTIIRGDSISGPLNRTNFVGGVSFAWPVGARLAFEPAVELTQKGTTSLDEWPTGPFQWTVRLTYIEVPLLLRANANAWHGLTPHVLVGPEIAFKVSCALSVSGGPPSNYVCEPTGANADYSRVGLTAKATKVDYGAIGGAGVDFLLGRRVITLDARYDYGLKNVFVNNDAKNHAFAVIAGMWF